VDGRTRGADRHVTLGPTPLCAVAVPAAMPVDAAFWGRDELSEDGDAHFTEEVDDRSQW